MLPRQEFQILPHKSLFAVEGNGGAAFPEARKMTD